MTTTEPTGWAHPSVLAAQILACTACEALRPSVAATVRPFVKPCAQFDIYTRWRPDPLRVVFLAEAPPGNSNGYFYDPQSHPGYKEILRTSLFDLLRLTGPDTASRLAAFKEMGYVLLDAIKCRCKKTDGQPPRGVTKTCAARWLARELEDLGHVERICILGKAALLALSEIREFHDLSRYSVLDHCGEILELNNRQVLIWPFLGWRNERVYVRHLTTFRQFCFVPG